MIIEKDKNSPGYYIASVTINGQFFVGSGQSHTEALERCFEKILWIMT